MQGFFNVEKCTHYMGATIPSTLQTQRVVSTSFHNSNSSEGSVNSDKSRNSLRDRISCVYFNARSIVNKADDLELLITLENPDIVGISETWLTQNISINEYNFQGYTLFRADRNDQFKTRGGGAALYIKNDLNPILREDITNENFPECVVCSVGAEGDRLIVGACYRPGDSQIFNDEGLCSMLGKLEGENFVIVGDFNFSELRWGEGDVQDVTHPLVECLLNHFIYQAVDKPTRGDNFLDLVLCSEMGIIESLNVGENFVTSDHQRITFNILCKIPAKCKNVPVFNYFNADYGKIKDSAKSLWNSFDWDKNVEDNWLIIKNDLLKLRDDFVGIKKKSRNKCKWATREVRKIRLDKKKAWNNYVKSGRDQKLYEDYKCKLKLSVSENKRAKKAFEQRLADNIKQDCKSFYSYVNSKSRSNNKIGPLKNSGGDVINGNKETANLLNEYFASVFTRENLGNLPHADEVYHGSIEQSLSHVSITEQIVFEKISKVNVNKSQGPDQIHNKMLFELRHELTKPLTELFKKSLASGQIPQDWRDANVIPLFKKGKRDQPQNYRPVSLTSVVGKILESIIKDNVIFHLEKFQLLKNTQHGFRSGRSCLTNILEFLENLTCSLDEGNAVDVVYLDFSKAFDKVPHLRLSRKLEGHGITGLCLKWIQNWLGSRRQKVLVDGTFSDFKDVTSGVPQGSVLGPLLFLVYINDIDNNIVAKLSKFADDSKLLKCLKSSIDADSLRRDLRTLETWAETWQMEFNVDKCAVLHVGNKNPCHQYEFCKSILKSVEIEKDLGILVDSKVKFSEQCNKAVNSANASLAMIKRNISSRNRNIIVKLYKALVRPKLEYCIQAWRPFLKKDIESLEKVQRRATKMIDECRGLKYEDRLKVTGLTTLEARRNRGDMIEVFKTIRGFNKVDFTTFFNFSKNIRTRGHGYKLGKKRSHLEIRRNFFSNRVVNMWNTLPENTVGMNTVNSFKNSYDKNLSQLIN